MARKLFLSSITTKEGRDLRPNEARDRKYEALSQVLGEGAGLLYEAFSLFYEEQTTNKNLK